MKYTLTILLIIIYSASFGQLPETTRGKPNVTSVDNNVDILLRLKPPNDTLSDAKTGSIAIVNNTLYIKNITQWEPVSGGGSVTPAALTKTDDANVTLTLGGTPNTALLQATSLTLGWTGALSLARGGTNNAALPATNGNLLITDGTKVVGLGVGAANQHLVGGTIPQWKDTTLGSPWRRDTLPSASATLNIVYPRVQADTIFIGATGDLLSNKPRSLFNVNGTARISGATSLNSTLSVQGASTLTGTIGVFATAPSNAWQINMDYPSTGTAGTTFGAIRIGGGINAEAGSGQTRYAVLSTPLINSAITTNSYTGFSFQALTSDNNIYNLGTFKGFEIRNNFKSNSTVNNLTYYGFYNENTFTASGGNQVKFNNYYAFYDRGISTFADTSVGTAYYSFYADSTNNVNYTGASAFGFYQKANVANTIKNKLEGNTLIGTGTQNASAALEVISTTQGVLFPRMTTTQRDAIASPVAGLVIYNTTTNKLNVYTTAWEVITSL